MDEDEAVARMRAADPAAGAEPDAERLAELTEGRRAGVPDELAVHRARRAPRWVAAAAVAAGALVVGGAGYGLGRATDDPAPRADPQRNEAPAIAQRPMAESDPSGATDMAIAPGYGGRTTFTAQGLSDEAVTAPAWAYDAAGTVTAEAAARAAAVFGLDGEPRQEGGWVVGPSDGSGPTLTLMTDGGATISFHDPELYRHIEEVDPVPLPEPDATGGGGSTGSAGDEGAQDGAVSSGVDGVEEPALGEPTEVPAPDEPAVPLPEPAEPLPAGPADAPSAVVPDGQAPEGPAGVVYETLGALGLDPDAAEYETAEHWTGGGVTSVVAHQLVDGRRTGQAWYADVVEAAVYSFNGPLAPLVELGEYDVVSPAAAVERLGDPRFGGSPVWRGDMEIMPMLPEAPDRDWAEPPGAPPAAGSAIPWPVTDVTIVGAEPALTPHTTDEGSMLLLPAYELSDADGRTWSVLAVADHELAF